MLRLLRRSLQVNVAECNEVRDKRVSIRRINLRQLLEHHGARFVIKAQAAEFFGDFNEVQA